MRYLLKPLHLFYVLYAFLTFLVCMFIAFPLVAIVSLWGKIKGGNLIYSISRVWADTWFFLIGIRHCNIFEYPLDSHKPYIFVANHISYLDIPVLFKAIRKRSIRALGKAEMRHYPIFGFIYSRGAVMVERSSPEKRSRSVRQLKSVLRKSISIFIFPEGTFNETHHPLKNFYDGAFRIAIETKTPIRPILFLDTYDLMHYQSLFSIRPGLSRAVFLGEVSTDEFSLRDVSALKEKVYRQMEEKLIEYRASWISPQNQ